MLGFPGRESEIRCVITLLRWSEVLTSAVGYHSDMERGFYSHAHCEMYDKRGLCLCHIEIAFSPRADRTVCLRFVIYLPVLCMNV